VDLLVRPARLEDAEGVVRAHEEASAEMFHEVVGKPLAEFVPFEARLEQVQTSIAKVSRDAQILVAERDGRIVGMAVWRRHPNGEGELKDLHVVPEAWGTGVATELIAAAADGLRRAGAEEAFLWVGEANPRARRFYEREGWAPDGTSQASSLGPTELRYRQALGPARTSE
jgi:GNAT superfamily N-acetyltransferase